jgi:hypothetical protein
MGTVQVLTLTDRQVELLVAMDGPVTAHVSNHKVWVNHQPYRVADLYVLRAARLVGPAEVRDGARGADWFELTDRGSAEAQLRGSPRVGGADASGWLSGACVPSGPERAYQRAYDECRQAVEVLTSGRHDELHIACTDGARDGRPAPAIASTGD